MGHLDKIGDEFTAMTSLGRADALAKARGVIEEIGSVRTWRLKVTGEAANGFTVTIKPTVMGALQDQTVFSVVGEERNAGTYLRARVTSYTAYQEKLLWVIPFGPKQVPGVAAYQKVLQALRTHF